MSILNCLKQKNGSKVFVFIHYVCFWMQRTRRYTSLNRQYKRWKKRKHSECTAVNVHGNVHEYLIESKIRENIWLRGICNLNTEWLQSMESFQHHVKVLAIQWTISLNDNLGHTCQRLVVCWSFPLVFATIYNLMVYCLGFCGHRMCSCCVSW